MNPTPDPPIDHDAELRAALTALDRAARMARQTAMRTGTDLVIFRDGRIERIPPEALRREAEHELGEAR